MAAAAVARAARRASGYFVSGALSLSSHTTSRCWLGQSRCLGVPGMPLADQLNLSQPGWADYAHQMIMAPPDFQTFLRP